MCLSGYKGGCNMDFVLRDRESCHVGRSYFADVLCDSGEASGVHQKSCGALPLFHASLSAL